jgi:hypothetical protein
VRSSTHRPRALRGLAAIVTTALAVGGLSVIAAAPAHADVTGTVKGGSFSWNVSEWAGTHLSTHTTTGDVTVTGGVFTFAEGSGSVNPTTGVSDLAYTGSAKLAFKQGPSEIYSVTISDPEITVDAEGAGEIVADVAYFVTPSTTGSANDVVVARFVTGNGSSDSWTATPTLASLTDTPIATGFIAPGSQDATDVGITDAVLPYDSQSFTKEFLLALPSSLRAHFYASKSSGAPNPNNPKKVPGSFTVTADLAAPTVEAEITSASFDDGVKITVSGDGFRAVTNPGDAGIYVGVTEAGGIESYASDAIGSFVAADWIGVAALTDGTFSRSYTLPASKLDPTKEYSVYTWQSHTHSNTSQDTETALDIDFAAIGPSVDLVLSHETAYLGDYVTALAQLPTSAVGSVEFFQGTTSIGTAAIRNGLAFKTIAGLTLGEYDYTAVYRGDATHFGLGSSTSSSVTVTKAPAGLTVAAVATTPYAKTLTLTAKVPGGTGKVTFSVDGKTLSTKTLSKGAASLSISTNYAIGDHALVVTYAGNSKLAAQTVTKTVAVVKASTSKVSVTGSSFKKNTAPKVTVTVAKLNNGAYATGTVNVYIGETLAKTVTLKASNKGKITVTLPKQSAGIAVTAVYAGTATVNAATSAVKNISLK